MRVIMFIAMLPYHVILIVVLIAVSAVPAAIIFPFMIIPSYYLNIKQYFSIMGYWWKGNRFQGNVEVDKMAPEVKARIKRNEPKIENENGIKEKLIRQPVKIDVMPPKREVKVAAPIVALPIIDNVRRRSFSKIHMRLASE
jgi:hypothetical protein